jgi:hypothetical protein
VAAVVLVAGGPILIYQSSQLKQYSFEAATCVLLIILALRTLDEPARRRILAFWITGAAAVWFATTAIFVVASVGGLLVLFALLERRWVLARRHVLAAAPAGASVLIVYLLTPPPPAWLYDWWSQIYPGSLAPESVGVRSGLDWAGKLAKGFSAWSLGATFHVVGGLVLVLLGVGVSVLLARMPRQGAVVIAPLVTGFVLALLRLYPMSGRLALWLVPIVLILLCGGVDAVVGLCRRLLDGVVAHRRAADAAGAAPGRAVHRREPPPRRQGLRHPQHQYIRADAVVRPEGGAARGRRVQHGHRRGMPG